MTEQLKVSRIAIIEGALISAAKCAEAAGKRATWRELAKAVDDDLTRPSSKEDGSLTLDNASVQRLMDYGLLHYTDEGWHVGEFPRSNNPSQDTRPSPEADALLEKRLQEILADADAMDFDDNEMFGWDAEDQPNLCVGDLRKIVAALARTPAQEGE